MPKPTITPHEREQYFKVVDGCPDLFPFVFEIYRLRKRTAALNFLIENRITGVELRRFISDECDGSILNTLAEIVKRIEHLPRRRQLYLDDFFHIEDDQQPQ